MKNVFFKLGMVLFGLLATQTIYAQDMGPQGYNYGQGQQQYAGTDGAPPADGPCPTDQKLNDCWCRYVHYEPCYYTTKRCEKIQVPCKKQCTRMVPKYYQVQRCKMVPQYYTETCCRQEQECYEVDDCKVCDKWCEDQHCRYVPKYYWKHVCGDTSCTTPAPAGACN